MRLLMRSRGPGCDAGARSQDKTSYDLLDDSTSADAIIKAVKARLLELLSRDAVRL